MLPRVCVCMYSLVQYFEIDIFLEYGTWLDEPYPSTHEENCFEIWNFFAFLVQFFRTKWRNLRAHKILRTVIISKMTNSLCSNTFLNTLFLWRFEFLRNLYRSL